MRLLIQFFVCIIFASSACGQKNLPHIVFVIGDEEYRSEESMPMLAQILKRELGAKISLCYPLDDKGLVNPNINNNISGLEALQHADMMVLFCRWRELPTDQAKYITDFAESGKPMAGFRTSTHTFKYNTDTSMFYLNNEWPTKVFGQKWITHHGHFDDGQRTLTSVYPQKGAQSTPIMNGVKSFEAYSWLYHVDGGEQKLNPDCVPFLRGKSLKSSHELEGNLARFPIDQPVAWTKPYKTKSSKTARVFFTTLGHPYDFKIESMRKMAINGIYWALGKEKSIPKNGVNVKYVTPYEPNNSGFGERYKQGMKPLIIK